MSKDDNESAEELKYKMREKFAPKSGHKRAKWDTQWLQKDVIQDELEQLEKGLSDYDQPQVNQAIVHTRQDMVLVYGMLSSNNERLHSIDTLLRRITKQLSIIVGVILVAVGFVIWSLLT